MKVCQEEQEGEIRAPCDVTKSKGLARSYLRGRSLHTQLPPWAGLGSKFILFIYFSLFAFSQCICSVPIFALVYIMPRFLTCLGPLKLYVTLDHARS